MFIPEKIRDLGKTIRFGQSTIAVGNTAVALNAGVEQEMKNGVIVQALSGNTGSVYVGGSTVTTANGFELQPGQATSLAIDHIEKVYINGANANDGVCWISTN